MLTLSAIGKNLIRYVATIRMALIRKYFLGYTFVPVNMNIARTDSNPSGIP